jgi:hypothetical protein
MAEWELLLNSVGVREVQWQKVEVEEKAHSLSGCFVVTGRRKFIQVTQLKIAEILLFTKKERKISTCA